MRFKQALFSMAVVVGNIVTTQAQTSNLVEQVRSESIKCSETGYKKTNEQLCIDVEKLISTIVESNNIEVIHERYIKEGIQMEMQFGGEGTHGGGG